MIQISARTGERELQAVAANVNGHVRDARPPFEAQDGVFPGSRYSAGICRRDGGATSRKLRGVTERIRLVGQFDVEAASCRHLAR